MPVFVFKCISPEHQNEDSRIFERLIHTKKDSARVTQAPCPECRFPSPRSYANEGFSTPGMTPIYANNYDGVKGSVNHEIAFAFGKNKKNPDGTIDPNAAAFSTTGEMDKYLNGNNQLGPPKLNDNGVPLRKGDGTFVREGAKLFKYNANASPSKRVAAASSPRSRSGGWVEGQVANQYGQGSAVHAPRVRTRER